MSTTDFEKNDGLDELSSEELEARAFGPDTDAPRRTAPRGAVRGLTPRPDQAALTAASPTSRRVADPSNKPHRTLALVAGIAVVALITTGVAVVATPDTDGETLVETYDEIEKAEVAGLRERVPPPLCPVTTRDSPHATPVASGASGIKRKGGVHGDVLASPLASSRLVSPSGLQVPLAHGGALPGPRHGAASRPASGGCGNC